MQKGKQCCCCFSMLGALFFFFVCSGLGKLMVVSRTTLFYILVWCSVMCSVRILEISFVLLGEFFLAFMQTITNKQLQEEYSFNLNNDFKLFYVQIWFLDCFTLNYLILCQSLHVIFFFQKLSRLFQRFFLLLSAGASMHLIRQWHHFACFEVVEG